MKFNPKFNYKKGSLKVAMPMKPEAEQRMFASFCRQLEATLMKSGFSKEDAAIFTASGGDPVKMAIAIAAIQIAREDRERASNEQDDIF